MNDRALVVIAVILIVAIGGYFFIKKKIRDVTEEITGMKYEEVQKMNDAFDMVDESLESMSDSSLITKLDMPYKEGHCFVYQVYEEDSIWYVEVDFIEFLTGDDAINYARRKGDAEIDVDENGDTTYFVFNDYYIANEDKKREVLELSENVSIFTYPIDSMSATLTDQTIHHLEGKLNNYPFIIHYFAGEVKSLHEQFIP